MIKEYNLLKRITIIDNNIPIMLNKWIFKNSFKFHITLMQLESDMGFYKYVCII